MDPGVTRIRRVKGHTDRNPPHKRISGVRIRMRTIVRAAFPISRAPLVSAPAGPFILGAELEEFHLVGVHACDLCSREVGFRFDGAVRGDVWVLVGVGGDIGVIV